MAQFFALVFGIVLMIVGTVFCAVSKVSIWHWFDSKASETNPLYRFFKNKTQPLHSTSLSVGRVLILVVGVLAIVLGAAIVVTVCIKMN